MISPGPVRERGPARQLRGAEEATRVGDQRGDEERTHQQAAGPQRGEEQVRRLREEQPAVVHLGGGGSEVLLGRHPLGRDGTRRHVLVVYGHQRTRGQQQRQRARQRWPHGGGLMGAAASGGGSSGGRWLHARARGSSGPGALSRATWPRAGGLRVETRGAQHTPGQHSHGQHFSPRRTRTYECRMP